MTLTEDDLVLFSLTAGIRAGPGRRRGDFMATIWRNVDNQLRAEYRFRWWNTTDKLDMDGKHDDDEKSFFGIGPVPDSAENRQKLKDGFRNVARHSPGFYGIHEQEGEWTSQQFILDVLEKSPMRTQITIPPREKR